MTAISPFVTPLYGFYPSPFGECCLAFSEEGIYTLTFPESRETGIEDLKRQFPGTKFVQNQEQVEFLGSQIFIVGAEVVLFPIGTPFQLSVWAALQTIPKGETTTYSQIAELIDRPKAARAVGTAIGANPIAFVIPCHRVIKSDGSLGGYRWGVACKMEMLKYERSQKNKV